MPDIIDLAARRAAIDEESEAPTVERRLGPIGPFSLELRHQGCHFSLVLVRPEAPAEDVPVITGMPDDELGRPAIYFISGRVLQAMRLVWNAAHSSGPDAA